MPEQRMPQNQESLKTRIIRALHVASLPVATFIMLRNYYLISQDMALRSEDPELERLKFSALLLGMGINLLILHSTLKSRREVPLIVRNRDLTTLEQLKRAAVDFFTPFSVIDAIQFIRTLDANLLRANLTAGLRVIVTDSFITPYNQIINTIQTMRALNLQTITNAGRTCLRDTYRSEVEEPVAYIRAGCKDIQDAALFAMKKTVEFAAYNSPILGLGAIGIKLALYTGVLILAIYTLYLNFTNSRDTFPELMAEFMATTSAITSGLMMFIALENVAHKLATMAIRFGLDKMPKIAPDRARERFFTMADFYANAVEDRQLVEDLLVEKFVYGTQVQRAFRAYQEHMASNSSQIVGAGNLVLHRQRSSVRTNEQPSLTGLPPEALQLVPYVPPMSPRVSGH